MSLHQATRQSQKTQLAPPKKYGVFLLNDHYTPMDFVVDVLQDVFRLPESKAVSIMLEACAAFTRAILPKPSSSK